MNIIQSIILGITEGATEFLPVSSSGHLIIVRKILGLELVNTLAYDAILQFASALALTIYFWKDIRDLIFSFFNLVFRRFVSEKQKTLLWSIVLGTIPAIVLGLLLESYMNSLFRNIKLVGVMLLLGSLLIYLAQRFAQNKKTDDNPLTVRKGIVIGLYQCLALLPGVSRSGATISGGLFSGLSRDETVRFSFLLSVPILLGSGLKELISVSGDMGTISLVPLFFGSLASFVVALLSIHYFIRFLKNHNFNIFIYYRIAVSLAIFFLF